VAAAQKRPWGRGQSAGSEEPSSPGLLQMHSDPVSVSTRRQCVVQDVHCVIAFFALCLGLPIRRYQ
jgi:hypothetical protein